MKEFVKLHNDVDNLDETIDNLAQSIGATDNNYKKPNLNVLTKSKELADLLIPLMNGDKRNDASELTSIILYTSQKQKFDETSKVFNKVMLVEMWHYDGLQEAVKTLGGQINQLFTNNQAVNLGSNPKEALEIAISKEEDTISNIQKVIDKLPKNKNGEIIYQLLYKQMMDEYFHIHLFTDELNRLGGAKDLKISI